MYRIVLILCLFLLSGCKKDAEDFIIKIQIQLPYEGQIVELGDTIRVKARIVSPGLIDEVRVFLSKETNIPVGDLLFIYPEADSCDIKVDYIVDGNIEEGGQFKLQVNALSGGIVKTYYNTIQLDIPGRKIERVWAITSGEGGKIFLNVLDSLGGMVSIKELSGDYSGSYLNSRDKIIGISERYKNGLRNYNIEDGSLLWDLPSTLGPVSLFINTIYFKWPFIYVGLPFYKNVNAYASNGTLSMSFGLSEFYIPDVFVHTGSYFVLNEKRPGLTAQKLRSYYDPGGGIANELIHSISIQSIIPYDKKTIMVIGQQNGISVMKRYSIESNLLLKEFILPVDSINLALNIGDKKVLIAHPAGIGIVSTEDGAYNDWVMEKGIRYLEWSESDALVIGATDQKVFMYSFPQGEVLSSSLTSDTIKNILLEFNR